MNYEIYRNMDKLGRVTIPADFRRFCNMPPEAPVKLVLTDDGILVKSFTRESGDNDRTI